MVNTKKTVRKEPRCPMCTFRTADDNIMKAHIVECGLQQIEQRIPCSICSFTTCNTINMLRVHTDRQDPVSADVFVTLSKSIDTVSPKSPYSHSDTE